MPTSFSQLVLVSAVVMGLSQTLTRERIFEPLRSRLGGKRTWLGYLVSCPYCASHAIAFVVVPLTGTYAIDVVLKTGWLAAALRWFLSAILVTVVAAFLRVAFWFVDERQALVRREKQLIERQAEEKNDGEPLEPIQAALWSEQRPSHRRGDGSTEGDSHDQR
jgi:predicted membrane metal-binding protein